MIAEHIQTALSSVCRTFQLDASQDDSLPFIVYSLSTTPINTKDGIHSYVTELTVVCVSNNIPEAVSIGNQAIPALQSLVNPEAETPNGITHCRFVSRNTDSETVDGGTVLYLESVNIIVKHQNP